MSVKKPKMLFADDMAFVRNFLLVLACSPRSHKTAANLQLKFRCFTTSGELRSGCFAVLISRRHNREAFDLESLA